MANNDGRTSVPINLHQLFGRTENSAPIKPADTALEPISSVASAPAEPLSIEDLLSSYQAAVPETLNDASGNGVSTLGQKSQTPSGLGAHLLSLLAGQPQSTPDLSPLSEASSSTQVSLPIPGFIREGGSRSATPEGSVSDVKEMTTINLQKRKAKGRIIRSEYEKYDTSVRLSGEDNPQLEVAPITVYTSEFLLVTGRKIAVNSFYICYALKGANIRILNQISGLRALAKGHSERITDMSFFSNQSSLLASASADGRLVVRTFSEVSSNGEVKIHEKVALCLRLIPSSAPPTLNPKISWHPLSEDVLFVAVEQYLVVITISQFVSSNRDSDIDSPLDLLLDNPPAGVQVLKGHEATISSLSSSPTEMNPFAIATPSQDGTVRVWGTSLSAEGRLSVSPVTVFVPFDGEPVSSAIFLPSSGQQTAPMILTGGPNNQSLKLWLPDSPESLSNWRCIQSLEFLASEYVPEPAPVPSSDEHAPPSGPFFNQISFVQEFKLVILANSLKGAVYVVHLSPSSSGDSWRMDYLAEFAVKVPILSFVALPGTDGSSRVKLFCVQTKAIQMYTLDIDACMAPDSTPVASSDSPQALPVPLPAPIALARAPVTPLVPPAVAKVGDGDIGGFGSPVEEVRPQLPRNEAPAKSSLNPELAKKQPPSSLVPPAVVPSAPPVELLNSTDVAMAAAESIAVEQSSTAVDDSVGSSGATRGDAEAASKLGQSAERAEASQQGVKVSEEAQEVPEREQAVQKVESPADTIAEKEVVEEARPVSGASVTLTVAQEAELEPSRSSAAALAGQVDATFVDEVKRRLDQVVSSNRSLASSLPQAVNVPVTREGRRLELSLGTKIEKSLMSHFEAHGALMAEEAFKKERGAKDRWQHEIASITNAVEVSVSQKLVPSLERLLSQKVDDAVGKHLVQHVHPIVKAAVQESMVSIFKSDVIPAMQASMAAALRQMDATLRAGILEHSLSVNKKLDESALRLQEQISMSAKSMAAVKAEVAESCRKMVESVNDSLTMTAAHGAPPQDTFSVRSLEQQLDPKIEYRRLLKESNFEAAFTKALTQSSLPTVIWLCQQVEVKKVFCNSTSALSQAVLLTLLHQLGSDLGSDTELKILWLREGTLALNPTTSQGAMHCRDILTKLHKDLLEYLPYCKPELATDVTILAHIVNSSLSTKG